MIIRRRFVQHIGFVPWLFATMCILVVPILANDLPHQVCADPNAAYCGFLYSHGTYTALFSGFAQGINNSGTIIGSEDGHGVIYAGGTLTNVDFPGADISYTGLGGINDLGQIVGGATTTSNVEYNFIYRDGAFTTIDFPAGDINNSGDMIGGGSTGNVRYGLLYHDGVVTTIEFPGATYTALSGINDSGEMVGTEGQIFTVPYSPFLYDGNVYTPIGQLGQTVSGGINNAGDFVGYSYNVGGFLYSGGTITVLDFPGAIQTWPTDINDNGDVVGYVLQRPAYLDEPSSFVLCIVALLMGAGLLCCQRRPRNQWRLTSAK